MYILWYTSYVFIALCFFFFKQKTAYEMRISDWSSDVCSSDLPRALQSDEVEPGKQAGAAHHHAVGDDVALGAGHGADDGAAADSHELLGAREAAHDDVVLEHHVTGQGRVVGHDDVVADAAVVGDVAARHEQAAVADRSDHAAPLGAEVLGAS